MSNEFRQTKGTEKESIKSNIQTSKNCHCRSKRKFIKSESEHEQTGCGDLIPAQFVYQKRGDTNTK